MSLGEGLVGAGPAFPAAQGLASLTKGVALPSAESSCSGRGSVWGARAVGVRRTLRSV